MTAADMLATDFATLPDLIHAHATEQGSKTALAALEGSVDYATLDALMDRAAAALSEGRRADLAVAEAAD